MGRQKQATVNSNPITKRFLYVIDYLVLIRKVASVRDFAFQIGTKPANITELRKGRNVNGNPVYLSKMVSKFNINGTWLLTGEGPMIKNGTQEQNDEIKSLVGKLQDLHSKAETYKSMLLGSKEPKTNKRIRAGRKVAAHIGK